MKDQMKGFVPMAVEDYFAHPYLGSSTISRARRLSWAHAMQPFPSTPAMRFGSSFHALIGEPQLFEKMYAKAPKVDRRTKEGKELYTAFAMANTGKTILTDEEYDALNGMLASVLCHKIALGCLTGGVAEHSGFTIDTDSGVGIKCRPDYFRSNGVIVDIKTAEDASADAFQRSLVTYGRHIQTALYLDVMSAVTGEKLNSFVHVVIEKKPPYAIAIYALDDVSIEQGRIEYKKMLAEYAWCKKIDHFPAYKEEVQTISLPPWGFKND